MQYLFIICIIGIIFIMKGIRSINAYYAWIAGGLLLIAFAIFAYGVTIDSKSSSIPNRDKMSISEKAEFICGKGKVSKIDLSYNTFFSVDCGR